MQSILLTIHGLVCVGLIGLVLLQQGKGADVTSSFGGGASQTLFGSQGTATFLSRTTAFFAAVFFASSLLLGYSFSQQKTKSSLLEKIEQQQKIDHQSPDSSVTID